MSCTITPLTEHTGAEVRGIDLREPIDDATHAALNRAFVNHHVLVIRDQDYTPEQFKCAAQVFGALQQHDKKEHHVPGHPDVYYVSNDEFLNGKRMIPGETFHTDHSNHPAPPKATTLFAVQLPSRGGDTQYVNMHLAYDELPAAMKQRIEGLQADHVYLSKYSPRALGPIDEASLRAAAARHPSAGAHASRQRPQGAVPESGAHGSGRRHAGQGCAGADRRTDAARDAAEIRIPPPVATRRHGDLGQPQRHAPGEPGLRHGRAALSVSAHAARCAAGVRPRPHLPSLHLPSPHLSLRGAQRRSNLLPDERSSALHAGDSSLRSSQETKALPPPLEGGGLGGGVPAATDRAWEHPSPQPPPSRGGRALPAAPSLFHSGRVGHRPVVNSQ